MDTVYIETSIVSYLRQKPSRRIRVQSWSPPARAFVPTEQVPFHDETCGHHVRDACTELRPVLRARIAACAH